MQQTSFPFQLIIGEDCSTDNTWEICKEYENKYPELIKLLPQQENNLGMMPNFIRTLKACEAKYIALCEGDDYWTDPLKLQKQVEVLNNNPEIIVCHHWQKFAVKTEFGYKEFDALTKGDGYLQQTIATVKEIFENKLRVKLRTMMFRNIIGINFFPEWFLNVAYGDVPLSFLLGNYGDFYFIDEPMAVYRKTDTGVSTMGLKELGWRKFKEQHNKYWIEIWDYADKHYSYKFHKQTIETVNLFLHQIINSSQNPYISTLKLYGYCLFKRNIPIIRKLPNLYYLFGLTLSKISNIVKRRILNK